MQQPVVGAQTPAAARKPSRREPGEVRERQLLQREPGGRWREAFSRSEVRERLSLLSLQALLAAVLVLLCLVLPFLPGLSGTRAAMARWWAADYSVSDARQAAGAWAARRGGWGPALAGLHRQVRSQVAGWAAPILPGEEEALLQAAGPKTGPEPRAAAGGTAHEPPAAVRGTAQEPPAAVRGAAQEPRTVAGGAARNPLVAAGGERASAGTTGGETGGTAPASPEPLSGTGGVPGLITFHRPAEVPEGENVRPVPGPVLSPYGWIAQGDAAEGERYHDGVDLEAAPGQEVRALRSGTVRRVIDHQELGRLVEIDHGDDFSTLYAPLQEVQVQAGDQVEAGQVLGRVTAESPGEPGPSHLHFEVHKKRVSVDPTPFLGAGGGI